MLTNKDLTVKKGGYSFFEGLSIFLPKGSKVEKVNGEYWLAPSNFTGIDRHDATYYGFRVKEADIAFN